MKKVWMFILTLTLCLQMTACTQNNNTEKDNVDKKTVVWRIEDPGSMASLGDKLIKVWQEPLNELLKEKGASYQVKIVTFNTQESDQKIDELKELKKNGNQTDIISMIFASYTDTDVASWKNTYRHAVDNKLLMNLDKWKEKNKKILEKALVPYDFELSKIDNKLYGISSHVPAINGLMYNKKMLDGYGINIKDIKGNIFDNTELLIQAKKNSGEIQIQFIGLDASMTGLWIVPPTNNLAWKKGEGFISLSQSKEFKNLLASYSSLKQQGLLNQALPKNGVVPFATVATMSKQNAFEINTAYRSISETVQSDDFVVVPNHSTPNMELYWGDNKTSIASWSENVENAEDFLLKLFTDRDIANLIQYGVKDQDYTLDEDNHITVTTKNNGLSIFGYQFTNPKITYSSYLEEDDKVEYSNWFYTKYGENFPKGFRFNPISVLNEINATNKIMTGDFINDFQESEWMNKIAKLEIEDLDTFLKDMNKELDDAGMQKIVDEANRQYQEWLKGAE
ncbi:DUF3502 domain-containing protein [Thomasclavelia sp.]